MVGCVVGSSPAHAVGWAAPGAVPSGQAQLRAVAGDDAGRRRDIEAAFGEVTAVQHDEKDNQPQKGVQMQVPEEELKQFVGDLSEDCRAQFSDIFAGKSELHTFGDAGGRSNETCNEMQGNLCKMSAQVTRLAKANGREMKSVTEVTGNSCLPNKCMTDGDLKVLASFMKVKAKDSMGSRMDVDIDLNVDCAAATKSSSSSSSSSKTSDETKAKIKESSSNSSKAAAEAKATAAVATKPETPKTEAPGVVQARLRLRSKP